MIARLALVITLVLGLLVTTADTPLPGSPHAVAARATTRPLVLPIPPGQTWYVCQGYNGELTHANTPALDFSLADQSVGSKGCIAGSKYSSAGSIASSPSSGTAYRWPGCCGDDFVCVNFDSGGSAAVGHLDKRVPSGTRVQTGDPLGTVAWPGSSNGDFAHIHVQVHQGPDCTKGSDPVAFDVAHGFKWACTPDLPYSGAPNQYSGLAVSRCGSLEGRPTGPMPPDELLEDAEEPCWLVVMVLRCIHVPRNSTVELNRAPTRALI